MEMTLFQRGRGGFLNNTCAIARAAALVLICVALGVAGCSSKKKTNVGTEGLGSGQFGEQNKNSSSSLENWQKNGIAGEEGPLHDIHFGYNDYTVQPQDSSTLRENASWLQAHPQTHVQVEGHCDERGSEEYNIALGAKRAESAKEYLMTLGISGSRITTISYGKELPLCTEHDESCWFRNRRDHFVVSGQ
jgi:peptidoglycan-associated lipoprotein